jgi:outer membrane biosynthesis protein TonB
MSEKINVKELPHIFLLNRHNLSIDQLSAHTQQLKKDLDKTLVLVINRSKDGNVSLTPQTQQKISTYDRYICDGIFEYLEEQDELSEKQVEVEEKQVEEKREEVEEKMEEIHTEQVEEKKEAEVKAETENKVEPEKQVEQKEEAPKKEEQKEEGGSFFDLFDF